MQRESSTVKNARVTGTAVPRRALMAMVLSALVVCTAAASLAAGWSIVPSPNASAAPNIMDGVTCLSASDCWAVGRADSGGVGHTLVEHWDGTSWTAIPSPDVPNTLTNFLSDVSCASANDCWAVGYSISKSLRVETLIEHWDGSSWTIVPSPDANPTSWNTLQGIECTSSSNCWAVGSDSSGPVTNTLIERWDGSSWSVVASPNANPLTPNILYDVSCTAATDCWAVGSYRVDETTIATLTEHWNGAGWSVVASPNPPGLSENILSGVTCRTASDCWAVGHSFDGAGVRLNLVQRWNGLAWSNVVAPNAAASVDNYLKGVSCTSASECFAVGYANNGVVDQGVILRWNGTLWLPATAPTVPTEEGSSLAAVVCRSGTDCWAVGSTGSTGSYRALSQHWNGTAWVTVTTANISARQSNFLDAVTCLSDDDCWAVGFWFAGNVAQTLTMHWDGSEWSIVPSPNVNAFENHYLGGVSCVSTSDCWAVGSRTETSGIEGRTLILHWDGTSWTIVPSAPDTSAAQAINLTAVSCASASECLAVGHTSDVTGHYQAISMTWDGTSWSLVPVPLVPAAETFYTPSDFLYAVSCAGPSDCWAAGNHWNGLVYQTLVEHWDGNSWTAATSPNTVADRDNTLSGVTCVSGSDCWAVGRTDTGDDQVLILRWNGTAWSTMPAPRSNDFLTDVACASASECWAVGRDYGTGGPKPQTLVVRWDGSSWSKVLSPNVSGTALSNNLSGVACAAPSDCWAVGQYWPAGFTQTLTMHYTPNLPPVAVLTANPLATNIGASVSFSGALSSDPDAGDAIASYTFDFGDGTPAVTQAAPDISHAYAASGEFTARLTVTDQHGLASAIAAEVRIEVLAITIPDPPIIGAAIPGNQQASIGFSPPASDGGSPITSYTVTCNPNGFAASGAVSPITVTGLANGTTYGCSVTATNAAGTSQPSATVSVTPAEVIVPELPAIATVDVTSSCQGSSEIEVTVTGTNFAPGSIVRVNGSDRFTTNISATRLQVVLLESDFASPAVSFRVASPDGGVSNLVTVIIARPGDVNLSGRVDSQDLVIVANYLVGNLTPGPAPFIAALTTADLNGSSTVNAVDIVILANHLVDNINCLPN